MGNNKQIVKNWRGSRALYNILAKTGKLDYWTRYSVKDANGVWTEYYGDNQITSPSGQLLPVLDIVATLPSSLNPGDRYLVGKDGSETSPAEYYIVTIYVDTEQPNGLNGSTEPFTNNSGMSVRVIKQGSMAYQLVDNILLTYDKVDGGCF